MLINALQEMGLQSTLNWMYLTGLTATYFCEETKQRTKLFENLVVNHFSWRNEDQILTNLVFVSFSMPSFLHVISPCFCSTSYFSFLEFGSLKLFVVLCHSLELKPWHMLRFFSKSHFCLCFYARQKIFFKNKHMRPFYGCFV